MCTGFVYALTLSLFVLIFVIAVKSPIIIIIYIFAWKYPWVRVVVRRNCFRDLLLTIIIVVKVVRNYITKFKGKVVVRTNALQSQVGVDNL